jgi:hypothetical protein
MPGDIVALYRQCDPAKPLRAGDTRYVSQNGVRGPGDIILRLANTLQRSEDPMHLLLTGHRGGGKSTELLRLRERLSRPAEALPKFFVVYFEADREDIDINDVDFPDLLLSMVRHVGRAFREELELELRPGALTRFVNDMRRFLGAEVEFDGIELDLKIAKLTGVIKNSPDARQQVRAALEPQVSNLISATNDFFDDVNTQLQALGYAGLVLIVDNLDRIVLRNNSGSEYNTHEQLFINRGSQLASLRCHVVYTIPINLIFSSLAPALKGVFNRGPEILPMIRVRDHDGNDSQDGLASLRTTLDRRVAAAETTLEEAFESDVAISYICRASGGHLRNLLMLVRSACDRLDSLPVTLAAAEEAFRQLRNDFERALYRPEHFDVIRKVHDTGHLPGSVYDQLLLYNLSVLEYENGEPWYAVNPAVLAIERFRNVQAVAIAAEFEE